MKGTSVHHKNAGGGRWGMEHRERTMMGREVAWVPPSFS